jgi:hypothetical protein
MKQENSPSVVVSEANSSEASQSSTGGDVQRHWQGVVKRRLFLKGLNGFSKLLDLNMLVMTGGRERTKVEFCALLDAADYKLTRIIPTMAPQRVIEAVPK